MACFGMPLKTLHVGSEVRTTSHAGVDRRWIIGTAAMALELLSVLRIRCLQCPLGGIDLWRWDSVGGGYVFIYNDIRFIVAV